MTEIDISPGAVERFRFEATAEFGQDAWCDPVLDPQGAWVRIEDYNALLDALAARDARVRRDALAAVESAYREGHQTGRIDRNLFDEDDDWLESAARNHPYQKALIDGEGE